jgi:methionine aminopeptidase
MVLAVEPLVCSGSGDCTARRLDGPSSDRSSPHHEQTLVVTRDGPRVLTA